MAGRKEIRADQTVRGQDDGPLDDVSSSRMLPGHEWASSSASTSGATRSPRLPIL